MSIQLAEGEILAKEYRYSMDEGSSRGTLVNCLTVTSERIVCESRSKYSASRKEMPLAQADFLSLNYQVKRLPFFPFLLFVLFAVGFLVGAKMIPFPEKFAYASFIMLGFAGALALTAVIDLLLYIFARYASVDLVISGVSEEQSHLHLSASNIKPKKNAKEEKMKIKVKASVASKMVSELGVIILNAKKGIFPKEEEKPKKAPKEKEQKEVVEEKTEETSNTVVEEPVEETVEETIVVPEEPLDEIEEIVDRLAEEESKKKKKEKPAKEKKKNTKKFLKSLKNVEGKQDPNSTDDIPDNLLADFFD